MIRKATFEEVPLIMSIIDEARQTMIDNGNATQWPKGRPSQSVIEEDIKSETGYVMEEDGEVVAYFAFKPSPDPTYLTIYDGAWVEADSPYYVIHRVASRRSIHGVLRRVIDFGFTQIDNIRIDTHRDNTIMQHLLSKFGFSYCGIIHLLNGDERLAYQKLLSIIPTKS